MVGLEVEGAAALTLTLGGRKRVRPRRMREGLKVGETEGAKPAREQELAACAAAGLRRLRLWQLVKTIRHGCRQYACLIIAVTGSTSCRGRKDRLWKLHWADRLPAVSGNDDSSSQLLIGDLRNLAAGQDDD